jgi:hypothetical protein
MCPKIPDGTKGAFSGGVLSLCQARKLAGGVLLGLLGWLLTLGCSKRTLESEGTTCRSDTECTAAQKCEPLTSPRERPMMVAPCMVTFAYCMTSADCENGQVCWPLGRNTGVLPPNCFPTGSTCGPPCTSTNGACLTDEVCETNGECRLPACDEADGMACPDHWRCDPPTAEAEAVQPMFGANEADAPNYARDAERGCTRIRCDEPLGYTCKDGWECDPQNAADPSGCVALPCVEAGRCSDDTRFICEPTSSSPRPMGGDAHGCVLRNCEEGYPCIRYVNDINVGYCDFGGPWADPFGCAWRPCDQSSSPCNTNQRCEPASTFADVRGCRPITCAEVASCGVLVCDPSDPNADLRGCVPPPGSGAGGMGGTAGNSGGATSGQAGTSGNGQGGNSNGGSAGSSGGRGGIGASGGGSGVGGASAGTASGEMTGRCVDR